MSRRRNPYDNRRPPRKRARTRYAELVPDRFSSMVSAAPGRVFSADGWQTGRLIALILLLIFMGLGYWLLNAQQFGIARISVNGSRYLSPDMVDATTGVMRQNIFTLREAPIVEDLKHLPFVLDVKVVKEMPNVLRVDVTERQRKLVWRSNGVDYLVDWDGVVLEIGATGANPTNRPTERAPTTPAASPASNVTIIAQATAVPTAPPLSDTDMSGAVVVEVVNGPALKVGDKVDNPIAVQSAQDLSTKLPAYDTAYSRLEYSSATGLSVVGPNNAWRAIFGTSSQFDRKISILKSLITSSNKWTTADLRFPERPAFK